MAKRLQSLRRRQQQRATRPKPRKSASAKSQQVARAKSPEVLRTSLVAQRTEAVLQLLGESGTEDVLTRAEVGGILREMRGHLPYGQWLRWVAEELPFTDRTARRAIALYDYQQNEPAMFNELASLGVAKAYLLIAQDKSATQQLLKRKHTISSTGARKYVSQMTFPELLEVLSKQSAQPKPDPADALVTSYRRQVKQLIRTLGTLVENRKQISEDDIEELHDDLLAATEQFAQAFDIET